MKNAVCFTWGKCVPAAATERKEAGMKWIFCGMIALSVVFGALNGRMPQVSNAAISSCAGAVELVLSLTGAMCLWSGIMNVADKAGITKALARLFSPLLGFLFKGISKDAPVLKSISMNITANLLGLGNAATPLGIRAMKELSEQNGHSPVASSHMILFVVLNTASIQLIPTTIATLRIKHGSVSPLDIMPAILLTSVISLSCGLLAVKICQRLAKPQAYPPKEEAKPCRQ